MDQLKTFIANDFERNAVVFKNMLFDQPRFTEAVFRAFKRWGRRTRSEEDGEFNVRTEAPGFSHLTYQNQTANSFLPREEDTSFLAYEKRIMKMTKGLRFQAVVNDLPAWDQELWEMVTSVLDNFYQTTGILARKIETGLFIGNFPYTPVGVHWDGDPVLTLMLEGSKTMRAWPKKLWEDIHGPRPECNYNSYLDRAYSVTGQKGEWIHCPSDFYHVFETPSLGVNFSLSFGGIATKQSPHSTAIESIGQLWKTNKIQSLKLKDICSETGEVKIPIDFIQSAEVARKYILQNKAGLDHEWMRLQSSRSLSAPLKLSTKPKISSSISFYPKSVLWKRTGDFVEIAANGNTKSFKKPKSIDKQLAEISAGKSVPIKNLGQEISKWLLKCGARK